ncbi:MAG: DUF2520 domain-containing protein [Gemmatimonadaceae bacterium]|nr:DUF2520 domain-containing protein [Chitinophagaceae bacterium]
MKIVLLGTGNVATLLGRKFKAAGHRIVQVYGRNSAIASELAYELESESCSYWSVVTRDADVYLLAITDTALYEVDRELRLQNQLVVHTAGSVSIDVLKSVSANYGVLYPLQSLRKDSGIEINIPLLIDANNDAARRSLRKLAESISESVTDTGDEKRMRMHLAAVFVNNFTNHLFVMAEEFCKKYTLPFSQLYPLILETVHRLQYGSPAEMQTGPAYRGDNPTLNAHMEMLKNDPAIAKIYSLLSHSIIDYKGLSAV